MYPHCLWGFVLVFVLVSLLYVISSFTIILAKKRELDALLLLSFECPVAHSHGAVGWSAVCDCGISLSYSLTFYGL